jgi:hypothetical protein
LHINCVVEVVYLVLLAPVLCVFELAKRVVGDKLSSSEVSSEERSDDVLHFSLNSCLTAVSRHHGMLSPTLELAYNIPSLRIDPGIYLELHTVLATNGQHELLDIGKTGRAPMQSPNLDRPLSPVVI